MICERRITLEHFRRGAKRLDKWMYVARAHSVIFGCQTALEQVASLVAAYRDRGATMVDNGLMASVTFFDALHSMQRCSEGVYTAGLLWCAEQNAVARDGYRDILCVSVWSRSERVAWQGKHEASFWVQLSALSARLLRNTYRHPILIAVHW